MLVDESTLRDLDEFSAPSTSRRPGQTGLTIVEFIDRTRSRAGRDELRRRLRNSEHSAARILEAQHASRILASDSTYYRTQLDSADLDAVEQYLGSNWHIPAAGAGALESAAGYCLHGWWRDYLKVVEAGRLRVRCLLSSAAQLQVRLSLQHSPALRLIATEIQSLLGSRELEDLARLAVRPLASRLAFDQLAREAAKRLLGDLIGCLGRVEAIWSIGTATQENGWVYPTPASRLTVTGLRHPFLGPEGVPNDLELLDHVRVCFVTGPNMAGKSTFLKALAVSILLAHAGCGVPATAMQFPVFSALFSSVRVAESLSAGESLYLAEVRRVRSLAQALREHGAVMAVLDEPLRGTNVHDAADATLAVVTRLANHPQALVFVASHIGEVVPALANDQRVRLLQFSAEMNGDEPRFDYRVREGVSTQRLGMTLLRRERVLELLERPAENSVALGQPR